MIHDFIYDLIYFMKGMSRNILLLFRNDKKDLFDLNNFQLQFYYMKNRMEFIMQ